MVGQLVVLIGQDRREARVHRLCAPSLCNASHCSASLSVRSNASARNPATMYNVYELQMHCAVLFMLIQA